MNDRTNMNIAIAVAAMLGTTADTSHPHVPIGRPDESLFDAIHAGACKLKNTLRELCEADSGVEYDDIAIPNPHVLNICLYLLAEQQWDNLPVNARKLFSILSFVLASRAEPEASTVAEVARELVAVLGTLRA